MPQFPLNEQQQAVVDWITDGTGSLNLVARAGCGKTYALLHAAIRTIVEKDLGEIVFLVFNRTNADEAQAKLKVMGQEDARFADWRRVKASTVHSAGFSAWRRVAPDVKVNDKKVLALIDLRADRDGAKSIWAQCSAALNKSVSLAKQSAFGFRVEVTHLRSWYNLLEHHAVDDLADGWTLDDIVPAGIELLQESLDMDREIVDFDDMILAPLVHGARCWPKDWVLLDEAQDTNAARRALALKILKPRTGRLIAVGDDRQAIYGFTGADSDALDLIAAELDSCHLPLTVTYRCPKAVVVEANRLVPDLVAHESAPEGVVRSVPVVSEQPCPVGDCVNGRVDVGVPCGICSGSGSVMVPWFQSELPGPSDVVLCRNVKPLISQAFAMLRAGLGCRVEGRDIGQGLVKLATRWKRVKTLSALSDKLEHYQAREVARWQAKGKEERAQAIEDRCGCLQELINALHGEGKYDVSDLVNFIEGLFGDTRDGEAPNVLTLSTIHRAKGREWVRVYLLDRAGTLPSPWARKPWQERQEENLEYVALTRTKREFVDLVMG